MDHERADYAALSQRLREFMGDGGSVDVIDINLNWIHIRGSKMGPIEMSIGRNIANQWVIVIQTGLRVISTASLLDIKMTLIDLGLANWMQGTKI